MVNQATVYRYTRQVIFVFIRTTVSKLTQNCLRPFQMREKAKKKNYHKSLKKCLIFAFFVERQGYMHIISTPTIKIAILS